MKEWIFFALFLIVGLGIHTAGIIYMRKEKSDAESVKIYRIVAAIGIVMMAGSVLYRFFA